MLLTMGEEARASSANLPWRQERHQIQAVFRAKGVYCSLNPLHHLDNWPRFSHDKRKMPLHVGFVCHPAHCPQRLLSLNAPTMSSFRFHDLQQTSDYGCIQTWTEVPSRRNRLFIVLHGRRPWRPACDTWNLPPSHDKINIMFNCQTSCMGWQSSGFHHLHTSIKKKVYVAHVAVISFEWAKWNVRSLCYTFCASAASTWSAWKAFVFAYPFPCGLRHFVEHVLHTRFLLASNLSSHCVSFTTKNIDPQEY